MTSKNARDRYPLHWMVWHNDHSELEKTLQKGQCDVEVFDPRGRTPLHLAVTLGHLESSKILLHHGANANAENRQYWTVVQEAVSTGDPELLLLCLQYRDHQRYNNRTEGVPALLQRLREAPDFYVEMKWEFTSWVPLVSRMCPSDTYKVWKNGSNVRIDTTLLGFDNMNWQRGYRSYIFKGEADQAQVMEIDHDNKEVFTEVMRIMPEAPNISALRPSEEAVAARLTAPIVTTYIDTDKIEFERNKSGIWGWRSDKTENVNSHECKVFGASNVELITKTRVEHLTETDKQRSKKNNRTPLESFLGIAEQHDKAYRAASNGELTTDIHNPTHITPEEYFNDQLDLGGRDIGRPKEQSTKTQKFKAKLWLCDDFPLSLPEQVIPIIDLMAASNAHFRKLKDFITLQLPSGFPIKIEIPLFHVLNARITFGNIYASDTPVDYVQYLESNGPSCCVVDESCFVPPPCYHGADARSHRVRDEDDELLQFAIQQSLVEAGTENDQVTFWEALNKSRPSNPSVDLQAEEERLLQRAIEESMNPNQQSPDEMGNNGRSNAPIQVPPPRRRLDDEEQLRLALEMSQRDLEEDEQRRREEEEELQKILQLSLTDK